MTAPKEIPMSDELDALVSRLRNPANWMPDDVHPVEYRNGLCRDSADVITALRDRVGELEAENEDLRYPTWPQWASEILDTLKDFGWRFDDEIDLPNAVSDWLREYPDSAIDGAREQRDEALARAETRQRDWNALRDAIRGRADHEEIERLWDRCERWLVTIPEAKP